MPTLFGRKKAGASPIGEHERRVVTDGHKIVPLPPREVKRVQLSPEEEAEIVWRSSYDRERVQAVADRESCGRCINGVVSFKVVGQPAGTTPCNCDLAKGVAS